MIECPQCGNVPRRGSRTCGRCGSAMPDARRGSERSFSKRPLSAQPQFAEPEADRDGVEWNAADDGDPFKVDRVDGSDPAVAHSPKPQSAYWDTGSSATMPTEPRHAVSDPSPLTAAVAVEAPLAYQLADSASVAILTEEAPDPDAAAPAPTTPEGGPQFAGPPIGAAPLVPAGVLTPAAPAPGTFLPAWSTSQKTKTRRKSRMRRARRAIIDLLIVAALGAGGYVAYPHVRTQIQARSVASDLRSYIEGKSVSYAPPGQGYSVRLPAQPFTRDAALVASSEKLSAFAHRSIVSGKDYEIVIHVDDLATGSALPNGLAGALRDPQVAGFGPANVHPTVFAGQTAYDYDLPTTPAIHARMFLAGRRLYVISVQAKSAHTVFDTLMKSFHLVTGLD